LPRFAARRAVLFAALVIDAWGCGSSNGPTDSGPSSTDAGTGPSDGGSRDSGSSNDAGSGFAIGGTVFGSGGQQAGLTLATSGEPNLLSPGAAWAFAAPVPTGTPYNVSIVAQPANNTVTCVVADGGIGTVGDANVTTVFIGCAIQLP
jgi:hypothetical protein